MRCHCAVKPDGFSKVADGGNHKGHVNAVDKKPSVHGIEIAVNGNKQDGCQPDADVRLNDSAKENFFTDSCTKRNVNYLKPVELKGSEGIAILVPNRIHKRLPDQLPGQPTCNKTNCNSNDEL